MLPNNEMQPQTDSDVFSGEGSHGQQHRMRQVPQVSLSGSCKLSRTERRAQGYDGASPGENSVSFTR